MTTIPDVVANTFILLAHIPLPWRRRIALGLGGRRPRAVLNFARMLRAYRRRGERPEVFVDRVLPSWARRTLPWAHRALLVIAKRPRTR